MPKHSPVDHVTAVLRAVDLLSAFHLEDPHLSLAELCRRTKLPKTTALRIARTLEATSYMVQLESGEWRLGPATAWLAARYQVAFDLHETIEPALHELARATGQSVSFFVHDGNRRVRLMRVRGDEGFASNVRVGASLPLDKGSPGKVILAFTGQRGKLYDEIRKRGFHWTISEAHQGSASVSAPVFSGGWEVVGAVCVAGPASKMSEAALLRYAPAVVKTARKLSSALSMRSAPEHASRGTWHP